MNTQQNDVQELKSERVQEELVVGEPPLVIELKSERVQSPESVAGAGQMELPSVIRLTVNPLKRVVVDVWWMGVVVAIEDPANDPELEEDGLTQAG
ncbi:MAG TPA: hypothetical protein VKM72_29735 [Thermoanaerobaculia bacterium]|nr:hypothetical protein [Thermoanaerobaculia bacterium]